MGLQTALRDRCAPATAILPGVGAGNGSGSISGSGEDGPQGHLEVSRGAGAHHGQQVAMQDLRREQPLPGGGVEEEDVLWQLPLELRSCCSWSSMVFLGICTWLHVSGQRSRSRLLSRWFCGQAGCRSLRDVVQPQQQNCVPSDLLDRRTSSWSW